MSVLDLAFPALVAMVIDDAILRKPSAIDVISLLIYLYILRPFKLYCKCWGMSLGRDGIRYAK